MTGPDLPPCMYGHPCHYDDDAGNCPCQDDDTASDEPRPITDVPTGSYL